MSPAPFNGWKLAARKPQLLASRDLVPERGAAAADQGPDARPLLAAHCRADAGADARGRPDDDRALLHRALRLPDGDPFLRLVAHDPPRRRLTRHDFLRIRGPDDARALERHA